MTAPSGSIHSPNYPNSYNANDDCEWLIEVDRNHVVQFTFVDFDVEPHQNCSYDYVALYDGANTSAPLIIQVCYFLTGGAKFKLKLLFKNFQNLLRFKIETKFLLYSQRH